MSLLVPLIMTFDAPTQEVAPCTASDTAGMLSAITLPFVVLPVFNYLAFFCDPMSGPVAVKGVVLLTTGATTSFFGLPLLVATIAAAVAFLRYYWKARPANRVERSRI